MRKLTHQADFATKPEILFDLLIRPSAIRSWWGARAAVVLPQTGGIWVATWGDIEDAPDYIGSANIEVFDRPHRIVLSDYRYFARSGPLPFSADFVVTFEVDANPRGSTLRITQAGFPDGHESDAFFRACEVGWEATLDGIRRYLQSHRTPG